MLPPDRIVPTFLPASRSCSRTTPAVPAPSARLWVFSRKGDVDDEPYA
jgi:hypothetical protein